ncbi:phosphopantetheine-binding protein [Streptomyces sp. 351MFTsu5.1]|uniref:phosphopantetheine-binding protein n=1 Tax=Streptomyces sp. 351MFTsu5.1 TaxID=1172180 RepID=UPI00037008C4|nr:phosphopantetheine-binding protein [Streptomyces sp. 351MFTsu5.1]
MNDVTQTVEELVIRRLKAGDAEEPADLDTPLTARGVDSLTIAALIMDIERTFGVRFPSGLITHDTFVSVRTVAAAVRGLTDDGAVENRRRDDA